MGHKINITIQTIHMGAKFDNHFSFKFDAIINVMQTTFQYQYIKVIKGVARQVEMLSNGDRYIFMGDSLSVSRETSSQRITSFAYIPRPRTQVTSNKIDHTTRSTRKTTTNTEREVITSQLYVIVNMTAGTRHSCGFVCVPLLFSRHFIYTEEGLLLDTFVILVLYYICFTDSCVCFYRHFLLTFIVGNGHTNLLGVKNVYTVLT